MAEEEERSEKKATENVLMQKFGPLPLIVWVALGAGVLGAVIYISKRKGAAAAQPSQLAVPAPFDGGGTTDTGTGSTPGPAAPNYTGQISDLAAQIKTLSQTVSDQNATVQANETSLGSQITNEGQQISSQNAVVGTLQGTITALGSSINSLAARPSQTVTATGGTAPQANAAAILAGISPDVLNTIDTSMGVPGYSAANPEEAARIAAANYPGNSAPGHAPGAFFDIRTGSWSDTGNHDAALADYYRRTR